MNYRVLLHELLQSRLRVCNPPMEYSFMKLKIGSRIWTAASKEALCRSAYNELAGLNESELRHHLGLAQRPSVEEMDAIRDVLKTLRQRVKLVSHGRQLKKLMSHISQFYTIIDHVEPILHKYLM